MYFNFNFKQVGSNMYGAREPPGLIEEEKKRKNRKLCY